MKKSQPIVTIAVVAYNEEQNILNLLNSIIDQKESGFSINQIWVHSDGSTDQTIDLVKSLKFPQVKLFAHPKRLGKSHWLNQIYQQLNADVIFAHPYVVRDMIKPLIQSADVGMSGGNPQPLPPKSFWERVVKVAFEPYQKFRSKVRGGNNAFSAIGQILAYRKELLKKITVPENMVTNDIFTYFCCLKHGFKYKFVKSAKVYFRSAQTISDLVKQNTRFQVGYRRMYQLFNPKLVDRELAIPQELLYLNAKWPTATTTKFLKG